MDKNDPSYKGQRGYNRFLLAIYDPWVIGFMTRAVWKVPVPPAVERYRRLMGRRHMDVGPGTGYFLEKAAPPEGTEIRIGEDRRSRGRFVDAGGRAAGAPRRLHAGLTGVDEEERLRAAAAPGLRQIVGDQLAHMRVAAGGGLAAHHDGDDVPAVALDVGDEVEAGGARVAGLDAVDALDRAEQAVVVAVARARDR